MSECFVVLQINECARQFFRAPEPASAHQQLCAETVYVLNDALCDFYLNNCPQDSSAELRCPPHVDDRRASHISTPG